jgi:predicted permease
MQPEVWIPLAEAELSRTRLEVVVRRHGATPEAVPEQLQRSVSLYTASLPEPERRVRVLGRAVRGTPDGEGVGWLIPPLVVTAVLLTLLIACANVAILMFARWTAREHELGIRSSLGGSRSRIMGLLLTESTAVAIIGGGLGVWAAFALRDLIIRNASSAKYFDTTIDSGILIQSALITILSGIVSGLAPAVLETRRLSINPLALIRASERVRQRWRHALVVLEVAVTIALLVGVAGQLDAYWRMLTGDLGFEAESLAVAPIEHPEVVDVRRALGRLGQIPGVARVAAATDMPFGEDFVRQRVTKDSDGAHQVFANRALITQNFFSVLGVPILVGRSFDAQEMSDTSRVTIVNEFLARRLWPAGSPIGAQLWIDNVSYSVVGVVATYRMVPLAPPSPSIYLPMADIVRRTRLRTLIRAENDPVALLRPIREEINGLRDGHVVTRASAFQQVIEVGAQEILALTYAMSPLLFMALFLTATGIFGVLAFAVSRRAKELALRVAMGAGPYDVFRLVAAHSIFLTAAGSAVGLLIMFGLTGLVRALGGAESALDTQSSLAFTIPVLIVSVIVALATWLPARRALSIDPARILRAD